MGRWTGRSILVTGGAGFLGRYVVARLRHAGADRVAVPRSAQYDLRREGDVERLLRDVRPALVVHLARPAASGPAGVTQIFQGTAVTLQPRRCYAIFAYGVGAVGDAGRLVTGFLRSSGGQAIVNNAFVMVPGTVNLTSQGGTLGYVLACNLSSSPQSLPAGWQLTTKAFTLP